MGRTQYTMLSLFHAARCPCPSRVSSLHFLPSGVVLLSRSLMVLLVLLILNIHHHLTRAFSTIFHLRIQRVHCIDVLHQLLVVIRSGVRLFRLDSMRTFWRPFPDLGIYASDQLRVQSACGSKRFHVYPCLSGRSLHSFEFQPLAMKFFVCGFNRPIPSQVCLEGS